MQFLPHRKVPLVTLVCLTVRNLDLAKMSLRLSARRRATRRVVWKTLLHREEDERILKCLCMIVDIEQKTGLYVMTSGTRLGWFVVVWLGLSVSKVFQPLWLLELVGFGHLPPSTFLLSPHFLKCQKLLLAARYFVRLPRERLLRKLFLFSVLSIPWRS